MAALHQLASDVVSRYDAIRAYQQELLSAVSEAHEARRDSDTPDAVKEAYQVLAERAEQDVAEAQAAYDRAASEFMAALGKS